MSSKCFFRKVVQILREMEDFFVPRFYVKSTQNKCNIQNGITYVWVFYLSEKLQSLKTGHFELVRFYVKSFLMNWDSTKLSFQSAQILREINFDEFRVWKIKTSQYWVSKYAINTNSEALNLEIMNFGIL